MTSKIVERELVIRGPARELFRRSTRAFAGDGLAIPNEIIVDGPAGTGKSTGIAAWLYWLCETRPKVRVLVVRKTRTSLTESFLVTFEDSVLPADHPARGTAQRAHRQSYIWPNGSALVLGGMDNPTRLYSTDYDVVYVQEAVELGEDEWERFHRALRNRKLPFQLLIGDTNPDKPTHWLYRRFVDGKCERISSKHQDNPSLFDATTRNWTPTGAKYLERLQQLTGVRRQRLYEGKWVAAEGMVWENWDDRLHLVNRPDSLDALKLRFFFAGVDWGFTAPGVISIFGVDGDENMYRVAEVYRARQTLEWWADRFNDLYRRFKIQIALCDPSRPDAIETFNRRIGVPIDGPGSIAKPADNSRTSSGAGNLSGIDLVRQALERDKSTGRPRLFFVRDSNMFGIDPDLKTDGHPTCTEEEIPGYVYKLVESGQANREYTDPTVADHGCDALRYAVSWKFGKKLVHGDSRLVRPAGAFRGQIWLGDDDEELLRADD